MEWWQSLSAAAWRLLDEHGQLAVFLFLLVEEAGTPVPIPGDFIMVLAAALVHGPDLLVMDEPTAGVDPILRAKFWEHFRELRDAGRTVFVTSQYITEAEYCDRIAVLGRGELVASGTPEEVRRQVAGGEMVDVVADGLDRRLAERLLALEGVRSLQVVSVDEVRLTVDQASVAIPRVLSALADSPAEVKQAQEYRPNFDEIFVQLMEQSDVESVD